MRIQWDNIILGQVSRKQSQSWGFTGKWFNGKCSKEKQVRQRGKQDGRRKKLSLGTISGNASWGVSFTWTLECKVCLSLIQLKAKELAFHTSYLSIIGQRPPSGTLNCRSWQLCMWGHRALVVGGSLQRREAGRDLWKQKYTKAGREVYSYSKK